MPLQNRVTPLGELIADPARGLVYGNRGCPVKRLPAGVAGEMNEYTSVSSRT